MLEMKRCIHKSFEEGRQMNNYSAIGLWLLSQRYTYPMTSLHRKTERENRDAYSNDFVHTTEEE